MYSYFFIDRLKRIRLPQEFDVGISPNEKIILFAGRLVYSEGIEYLIEAMQEVEAKYLIVGIGELQRGLEKKSQVFGS